MVPVNYEIGLFIGSPVFTLTVDAMGERASFCVIGCESHVVIHDCDAYPVLLKHAISTRNPQASSHSGSLIMECRHGPNAGLLFRVLLCFFAWRLTSNQADLFCSSPRTRSDIQTSISSPRAQRHTRLLAVSQKLNRLTTCRRALNLDRQKDWYSSMPYLHIPRNITPPLSHSIQFQSSTL
jgi:hypothetical protein